MSGRRVFLRKACALPVVVAACGWLAACGPDAPPQTPGTPVSEQALPHPTAGLWEWDSRAAGRKQLCLSGQVLSVLAERPGCPVTRRVRAADGSYVVEAACGGGRSTWARAQGDFSSAFSADIHLGDVADHADARYLGPCPAGRRPHDQP
jgi:hypothetical protein